MDNEKYKALLELADGDSALVDELLSGLAVQARGKNKAELLAFRASFREKAARPQHDIIANLSDWLVAGGDPRLCL